jgi:glutathione reductase (NADPH)
VQHVCSRLNHYVANDRGTQMMSIDNTFDLIVLGSGSGGMASAMRARRYGARVAVIEKAHLGGTCVNLGCVPKKVMFNATMIAGMLHKASDYCFSPVNAAFDWSLFVEKRNAYVERLREIYNKRYRDHDVTQIRGYGRFVTKNKIEVNGCEYTAPHIIIATGGEPTALNIPGSQYVIDSDGFFDLTMKPKRVAVIGSGYIGVELAGILQGLGVETHLLVRKHQPLQRFDSMLGPALVHNMQQQGIILHTHFQAKEIIAQSNGLYSVVSEKNVIINDIDVVISAIGRNPCTSNLNLDAIGINVDEHGFIPVDQYQNTAVNGIYAVGDITPAVALTPVAIAAGRTLSDRLFGQQPDVYLNYDHIGSVVFSHPPIGTVGLSEQDAIKKYGKDNIKVHQKQFNPMFEALSEHKTPAIMKLITLGVDEKIIGLHLIGYGVDEILQGFVVALKMGARKCDLDRTIAIHPSSAEELVGSF